MAMIRLCTRLCQASFRAWVWLGCILGLSFLLAPNLQAKSDPTVYQFGVFAYKGVERTREEFAPVVAAINQTLDQERLQLQVLTQEEIYAGLAEQRLDFITTNPTHFLTARKKYKVSGALATLVKNHEGQPMRQLGGVILTRADQADIEGLSDLAGHSIAAPGPEFMGGYRAQVYELHLADEALDSKAISFVGTHQAVVAALATGEADVGFIRDGVLESLDQAGLFDRRDFKVIHAQYRPSFPHVISTRLYPEWPVFAMPHVSDATKRHITAALLSLEVTDLKADAAEAVYGFSVPADYLQVESLARALKLPPFANQAIDLEDFFDQYFGSIVWLGLSFLALVIAVISLLVWVKKAMAANLYSQELLASQDEIVLVNDGNELVDVSGGFFKFFQGRYQTLAQFKQDYGCICDLFVKEPGYLYNHKGMDWVNELVAHPDRMNKAIVSYQGQRTVFKCTGVLSSRLGLYLITLVDITELEDTHQQLAEQTQVAQEANETKSKFLANMSHEIRTPMNGIIGLSELALQQDSVPALHQRLQKIHDSGRLLLGIINDILDISKIEAGRFQIEPEPFALAGFLDDLIQTYAPSAEDKGLSLKYDLSPATAAGYEGDHLRLRQVLTNLLSNAIKFTEQGSVLLRVRLAPENRVPALTDSRQKAGTDQPDWVLFEVKDTGIGITQPQQARLFAPFSQADDTITRRFGGTGLGLVISDKLVRLMGGDGIHVQSELDQGSVFYFALPMPALSSQAQQALMAPTQASETVQPAAIDAEVLLVEDNAINQEVAASMLSQLGVRYDVAENGEQAVQKAQEKRFDLIFMDIQMPVMDGYQATRLLREQQVTVPIIALTAAAMIEDKNKAQAAGMDDHLSKPIAQSALRAALDKWVEKPKPADTAPSPSDQDVLVVHPDKAVIKQWVKAHPEVGKVRIATTIEKARQLLQAHPAITHGVLAKQWAEHQPALASLGHCQWTLHD